MTRICTMVPNLNHHGFLKAIATLNLRLGDYRGSLRILGHKSTTKRQAPRTLC